MVPGHAGDVADVADDGFGDGVVDVDGGDSFHLDMPSAHSCHLSNLLYSPSIPFHFSFN